MRERALKCFFILFYALLLAAGLFLLLRLVLPAASPFLLAFALASLMEPAVRGLSRRGLKRSFVSGALTLTLLALLLWGLFSLVSALVSASAEFAREVPELVSAAGEGMERLERRLLSYADAAPETLESYMLAAAEALGEALRSLPVHISRRLLDFLSGAAQRSPHGLLFAVTAGLGSYFISSSYPAITAFMALQLPEESRLRLRELGKELKTALGGFLRSQLILMAMSFFQLLLAFLLLGVKGAAGIAALTAAVDALPVFGTGIVLVPWALYCLLLGNYSRAAGLLICWGAVNLVRSCAQAKLLGDEIGLSPVASLTAIYLGWRVWGVWGMLSFPLIFVLISKLNSRGIIRLWKNI